MKHTLLIISFIISLYGIAQQKPLTTVKDVNQQKYLGKWYSVASYPARFQKNCFCTVAEYRLSGNGKVKIINYCRKGSPNGKLHTAHGKAFPVAGSNNSKFKVQFFWPFRGDYWIIALDKEYHWAAVSEPNRKYLWILSRTPVMENDEFQKVLEIVKEKGFDLNKLELTEQKCR